MLILDEPDSHLHPDNQRKLCNLISSLASERGFQALICTHSRHVLDATRDRAAIFWLNRGKIVEGADVDTTTMLLDLGALDSVDYFAKAALRCVVVTEDTNTEKIKALLWSNGFRKNQTEIASYSGCSKIESALVLGNFLKDRAHTLNLVVHRDRDYLSDNKIDSFKERLAKNNINGFITQYSDIEGYYLNLKHISKLNPKLSEQRVQELIDIATEETKDKSITVIINTRTKEAHDNRKSGGASVNHGKIAVQASKDYEVDRTLMRRGKYVLGRLISLIQQEIGETI
jgi:ABC-type thiamine transport system ATPase subunit